MSSTEMLVSASCEVTKGTDIFPRMVTAPPGSQCLLPNMEMLQMFFFKLESTMEI